MPFQMGMDSLGGTVFFQVGLCTPLQTMEESLNHIYIEMYVGVRLLLRMKKNCMIIVLSIFPLMTLIIAKPL